MAKTEDIEQALRETAAHNDSYAFRLIGAAPNGEVVWCDLELDGLFVEKHPKAALSDQGLLLFKSAGHKTLKELIRCSVGEERP